MSSPFPPYSQIDSSTNFASQRTVLTAPTSPPPEMDQPHNGLTVRPMNLKVLYSFDEGNKQNCLARWPHVLDIQTALMDENTEIGIIPLKMCLQAIVNASPELVAKLGHDYTIYAYDYSEYETPLVGQGMLSWILASASPTPNEPAHRSNTIVTGRVLKNMMGLFTKGAHETLEVKLRLVQVPNTLQSEYLASMQKYREMSDMISPNFDPQIWTAFIQANPGILPGSCRLQFQQTASNPIDATGRGVVQQMLRENSSPQNPPTLPPASFQQTQQGEPGSSRPHTPVTNSATTHQRPADVPGSRPGSRTSMRGNQQPPVQQTQPAAPLSRKRSISGGCASNDDVAEEGPARKRAKIVKADYPVANTIEKQPDSLRVAAGMAASVRHIYRPTPVNPAGTMNLTPGVIPINGSDDPVRPPTPINIPGLQRPPRLRVTSSNLRRESLNQGSPGYVSSCAGQSPTDQAVTESGLDPSPGRSAYSGSLSQTPANIPSSPPVFEGLTSAPGTPQLPPVRRERSQSASLLGDEDFQALPGDEWIEEMREEEGAGSTMVPPQYPLKYSKFRFKNQIPGDPDRLPKKMLPRPPNHRYKKNTPDAGSAPASDFPGQSPPDIDSAISPYSTQLARSTTSPTIQQPLGTQPSEADVNPNPALLPPQTQAPQDPTFPVQDSSIPPQPQAPSQSKPQPQRAASTRSRPNSRPSSRAGSRPRMNHPLPPLAPGPVPLAPAPAAPHIHGRPLERTQSLGSMPTSTIPASDPVQPQSLLLPTPQIWEDQIQHPASDAPMSTTETRCKNNLGPGAKRSRQIQQRLQQSITKGVIPPYCENCGAIETPTWRKAYGKVFTEGYENVHLSDAEGGIVAVDEVQRDEQSKVISYRLLKRSVTKGEDKGENPWVVIQLCNPCGLHFFKWKQMRPEDKWVKKPKDPNSKRKRPPRKPRPRKGKNAEATDGQVEQGSMAATDGSSPADPGEGVNEADEELEDDEPEQPAAKRLRAQSAEPSKGPETVTRQWEQNPEAALGALQRAIQASPAGRVASRINPNQLEENPSVRRQLFPSPRKDGAPETLENASLHTVSPARTRRRSFSDGDVTDRNGSPQSVRRSPRGRRTLQGEDEVSSPFLLRRSPRINKNQASDFAGAEQGNKENEPPQLDWGDGLGELFGDDAPLVEPPATPTPSSRRHEYVTPPPAETASQFKFTPGMKTIDVKEVMKLMKEPPAASPLTARMVAEAIDKRAREFSPISGAFTELVRDSSRSDAYTHKTPTKSADKDTPDSQLEDPEDFDLSMLDDIGPNFNMDTDEMFGDDVFGNPITGHFPENTEGAPSGVGRHTHGPMEPGQKISPVATWDFWNDPTGPQMLQSTTS